MRLSNIIATSAVLAVAQAAPLPSEQVKSVQHEKFRLLELSEDVLHTVYESISNVFTIHTGKHEEEVETDDEDEGETPGDHWKKIGKDKKKHWKKIGKDKKKKYAPPSPPGSDDESDEGLIHPPHHGKHGNFSHPPPPPPPPGKHGKGRGRGRGKKHHGPPPPPHPHHPCSDDDSDDDEFSDKPHGPKPHHSKGKKKHGLLSHESSEESKDFEKDEEPETPGDHWKKIGKDKKKHWKNVGKDKRKKFAPPPPAEEEPEKQADVDFENIEVNEEMVNDLL